MKILNNVSLGNNKYFVSLGEDLLVCIVQSGRFIDEKILNNQFMCNGDDIFRICRHGNVGYLYGSELEVNDVILSGSAIKGTV